MGVGGKGRKDIIDDGAVERDAIRSEIAIAYLADEQRNNLIASK